MRAAIDASKLLRAGLLEGVSLVCAGAPGARSQIASDVARACVELGAHVRTWSPEQGAEGGAIDVVCVDGASAFSERRDARAALSACLELSWDATRALVGERLLAQQREGTQRASAPAARACRIIYLAPPPTAGAHADAARAGLENLARTLSIEWARFGVSTVAIAPGASTSAAHVGALVAYLCSPAASYFSGCLLDLTGPAVSLPA